MFNVYVNGVDPKRIGELEKIKRAISEELDIEGAQLDRLCAAENGPVCFKENVSIQGAINIRDKLMRLGLLCSYRSSLANSSEHFSLVPLEEQSDLFICPACNQQKQLNGNPEPKLCPFCNQHVNQYRQEQAEKAEYEEIRKKMLRLSQTQHNNQLQHTLSQQEKQRKERLEAQVAKELGLKSKFNWQSFGLFKSDKPYYDFLFFVAVIGLLGFGSYRFFLYTNTDELALALPEQSTNQENIPKAIPFIPPMIVVAQGESPSVNDIFHIKPIPSPDFADSTQTPAQQVLAKNYNDVMDFMMLAGSGNRVVKANSPSTTKPAPASQPNKENTTGDTVFLDSLFHEIEEDVEWRVFLNKTLQDYIKAGKLKSAYKLSQYQADSADHIRTASELLTVFKQLGLNDLIDVTIKQITQYIKAQPKALQAMASAQFAVTLQELGKTFDLFDTAEKLAATLSEPVLQSQVLSKIALYQKMAGQPGSEANLTLAEEKLKSAKSNFSVFSGYIHLAHDIINMGLQKNAERILNQAESLLPGLSGNEQQDALALLLDVAYATNNTALADKYMALMASPAYRSRALYQNIKWQLQHNTATDAYQQRAAISDVDFAAVARALTAFLETDPGLQQSLIATARQQLSVIAKPENKAIATSKVARYLYRIGSEQEALNLFEQALDLTASIQESKQKDAVLIVLAMDKARVFLDDDAIQIVNRLQDNHFKPALLDMISNAVAVKSVLSSN